MKVGSTTRSIVSLTFNSLTFLDRKKEVEREEGSGLVLSDRKRFLFRGGGWFISLNFVYLILIYFMCTYQA